jgi:hypothetical protein
MDVLLRLRLVHARALICECWTGAGLIGSRHLGDSGGSVGVMIKGSIPGASFNQKYSSQNALSFELFKKIPYISSDSFEGKSGFASG